MSYFIEGFKLKTTSMNEINNVVKELKELSKKDKNFSKKKLLQDIVLYHMTGDMSLRDILLYLNSHLEISHYDEMEGINEIKTIEELMPLYYKETMSENLHLFIHENYDFALINNTLDKLKNLLSDYKSDLLSKMAFSTYSGEVTTDKDFEIEDKNFIESLKKENGFDENNNDDFEAFYDNNEYYEKLPSYVEYNKVKCIWEDFTAGSYYINQKGLRIEMANPKREYEKNGIMNFDYSEDALMTEMFDDIPSNKLINLGRKLVIKETLNSPAYKEKMDAIKKPSDYMRLESEVRDLDNFEELSSDRAKKVLEDKIKELGKIKISEFIKMEIF